METVGRETYELPLFDEPLIRLTFSPEGVVDDPESQNADLESGTLHIKETAVSSGRGTLSVIHKHDDDRVGWYRFEVLDRDQRICRYAGSDVPPWSIYCAVTKYGYHCQTAPQSKRKYAFDLLDAGALELLQRVQEQEYEYSTAWGLRVFEKLWAYIRLAALEYQVGAEHMNDVVSILSEQQGDNTATALFDNMARVFEEYNVENAFIPHSLRHPSTASLMNNDADTENVTKQQDTQSETDNAVWAVTKHRGHGDSENVLFVSIIGSDAIDRFSFEITDEGASECVAQTNVVNDFPPYTVIESVREEFEITNIPTFTYTREGVAYSRFLLDLDRVVRRTTKQVSPTSEVVEAMLDDYITSLDVYLSVVAAYEIAPEEYNRGVTETFSQLGIELTTQNISKLSHSDLDQITAVAFQAVDDVDQIKERARELLAIANTGDRRRVDVTEDPDVSLAARLVDTDPSIHK